MPTLDHERLFAEDRFAVIGVDEAGRGPLAGPVVAAALSIPDLELAQSLWRGPWAVVNDSKKLSEKRRDEAAEVIKSTEGVFYAVAEASAKEIDSLNILKATHLAMRRAASALAEKIKAATGLVDFRILVDGLAVQTLPFESRNLVKGDSKSLFIAAASILAKTARDAYCREMDAKYPQYGFAVHKGYPTAAHLAALDRFGPCPEHRMSFGPVREQMLPL